MKILFNLLVPGLGLVILQRAWLGSFLAVIFGFCGDVALAGWLIAPAAIPAWLAGLALALAAFTWLSAQVLFWRQMLRRSRVKDDLRVLLHQARMALDRGDFDMARACVDSGIALDEDDQELRFLRTRLSRVGHDGGSGEAAPGNLPPRDTSA